MSNLLPIPPDSPASQGIARMEEVLQRIREVAKAAEVADRFAAHDASSGGVGCRFSELYLSGEGDWDWQRFYHYYGLHWRSSLTADLARSRSSDKGPQWVKFSSEDRLAWGKVLPAMLDALEGLPISVSTNPSMRWDRTNVRACGKSTYVPVYSAMVVLLDIQGKPFNPATASAEILGKHCMAEHPLADKHLFDWQEDVFGELLFRGYGWNRTGFWAQFDRKANLERACLTMFEGMSYSVTKHGKGPASNWVVAVDLTASSKNTPLEPVAAAA